MVTLDGHKSTRENQEHRETYHDLAKLVEDAERMLGAYPDLKEPTFDDEHGEPPRRLGEAERIVTWTMNSMFGAITIFAMATGDRALLRTLLTLATLLILRLLGRRTG
ncbi:MAG TPA: hypothetical protein VF173_16705 [Thermoanaerobaculia bacterium]|nr:hypothetical protein [Thermoanaerobaculia bacterium]